MAPRAKRKSRSDEASSPSTRKTPRREATQSMKNVLFLDHGPATSDEESKDDRGRRESERVLSAMKPKLSRTASKEDAWLIGMRARIADDETRSLHYLRAKREEVAKSITKYHTDLRTTVSPIIPVSNLVPAPTIAALTTTSPHPPNEPREPKESTEMVLQRTSHPLHPHLIALLNQCAKTTDIYRSATSRISRTTVPPSPASQIEEDKERMARVLEAGRRATEEEVRSLILGLGAGARAGAGTGAKKRKRDGVEIVRKGDREVGKGDGDGATGRNREKERWVKLRTSVVGDGGGEMVGRDGGGRKSARVEETRPSIGDILDDVGKGVAKMVRKLPVLGAET